MEQKKVSVSVLCLAVFGALFFAGQGVAGAVSGGFDSSNLKNAINAQEDKKNNFVDGEIVVKTRDSKDSFQIMKVQKGKVWETVQEINRREDVEYAEPNYIYQAQMVPDDPNFAYQWNFKGAEQGGINAQSAWDITAGNNSVVVAVIDTGVAYENYNNFCQAPDLSGTCFAAGYNFLNATAHANDDNGHGTHVAGTIAQSTNNGLGVAGIANNACIMPLKVLDSTGSGTLANVAAAIKYAADNGAKVINLSLGGTAYSATMEEAAKYAYEKGVVIFAACGNSAISTCLYPAANDAYVIAVGATQYNKTLAPYSNYGASVDVMAPGGNTALDANNDGYADGIMQQTFKSASGVCSFDYYLYQGTSMATPHAAATAALLISNGNAATPDQIRLALQESALDLGAVGKDNIYGYGLVDAYRALQWTYNPECTINTDCDNGIFCDGAETCQLGKCVAGTTVVCNDNNSCSADSCNEDLKKCENTIMPDNSACLGGVCCAGVCKTGWADCSSPKICWNGANNYLYHNSYQYKKFCKCAQGTYNYRGASVSTYYPVRTVFKYTDVKNNTNWLTESLTSKTSASKVICSDGKSYLTNATYYQK